MIKGEIIGEGVVVWDKHDAKELFNNGWYGGLKEDRLELALVEACSLLERGKIEIIKNKRKVSFEKFLKHANKIDKRFNHRYAVYKDLRGRGLPTRTGLKFGCDFRVYERGVKPIKKGPKTEKEHTKWIVFSVSEDYICSFHELSRAVRLAQNIRAQMLWAVVDNEGDVTYYQVTFITP